MKLVLAAGCLALAASAPRKLPPPITDAVGAESVLRRLDEASSKRAQDVSALETMMAEYLDLGRAPYTADPLAARARRERIWGRMEPLIMDAWALANEEKDCIEAIGIAAVAHRAAKGGAGRADSRFQAVAVQYTHYQTQHARLNARQVEISERMRQDITERTPWFDARFAANERLLRLLRWGPRLLAGLLGAAGLVLLLRRRAPRGAGAPKKAPPEPLRPFLVGGRYEASHLLSHGGAGETYAATDRDLQREVTLRKMRLDQAAGPQEREALAARLRAVSGVRHPNLPRILSVELLDGDIYAVCEALEGETLEAILSNRGRLGWEEALSVLRRAGYALQAAHAAGFVHGDVRPANILLGRSGDVKLMDLGVGARPSPAAGGRWQTRPQGWGAAAYRAPEQDRGTLTPSCDVYALAVCGYQMLAGTVPFHGPDFDAQKARADHPALSAVAPALPGRLDSVFSRALRADPAERFASAEDFVRALETV